MKKLLLILIACLTSSVTRADQPASTPADSETRGDQIIREWIAGNRESTSVRGKVCRIIYDDVFHIQKTCMGEFGYRFPGIGYLKLEPSDAKTSQRRTSDGEPYQLRPDKAEHWRWYPGRVRMIADADKYSEEFVQTPTTHGHALTPSINTHLTLLGPPGINTLHRTQISTKGTGFFETISQDISMMIDALTEMDGLVPFLPGTTNERLNTDWSFHVIWQTRSHAHIRATPCTKQIATRLQHCELRLTRNPWRLVAQQMTDRTGNTQTTYLFGEVDLNAPAWPEPDLSAYKQVRHVGDRPAVIHPAEPQQAWQPARSFADLYWSDAE